MNIAVLVSGGVDSSVALALLKHAGYNVTAFYLKIWLEDELAYLGNCPWQEDLQYVQAVCTKFDVPLEVISLQREYWDIVVSYALDQIKAGRTPNPDILCNQHIKFGVFYDKIGSSFHYVATGHYAQTSIAEDGVMLLQSPDPIKDQTYFLSQLRQDQIKRAIFPIGHLHKAQVRQLAHDFDLPTKLRKDSQGICFLGKFKFEDFLRHHLGQKPGAIIEMETGKLLGQHAGFWFYTVGQRQGLGLAGGPWYVVKKDVQNNIIFVSRNYYTADKQRNMFVATDINWINARPAKNTLGVKIRHGAHTYQAAVQAHDKQLIVTLDQDDQGIAAGQYAAFYDGNVCLGSGVIERTLP